MRTVFSIGAQGGIDPNTDAERLTVSVTRSPFNVEKDKPRRTQPLMLSYEQLPDWAVPVPMGSGPLWWGSSAAVAGLGMAMLYPNLSAAVADIAHPSWRASAIGIYRFWRDLGYGIGALGLGAAAALGGHIESAFWFVAVAMLLSGAVLFHWGEETHPRLNPAH